MDKKACLLLHGFGGSTFELKGLQSALEKAGFKTRLPLLPGHNTSLEDFSRSRYQDWYAEAEKNLLELKKDHQKIFVLGFSMGGSLTLDLALKHNFIAMILIAAPVFLTRIFPPLASDYRLFFVPVLKYLKPLYPTGNPHPQSRQIAPWQGYEGYTALKPLHSFLKNLKRIKKNLKQVKTPFLAIYAPTDKTVPLENAFYLLKKTSSPLKELTLLQITENITSNHLLPTHQETKAKVEKKVLDFFSSF
ncbi:MAG: carboxylesterase [Desulfonauticus sp.]|jgi:carboxylesterase|nr:carboxylesterase [Desulfonauticus sp.]